ncbi:hypothetical protein JNK13_00290 [bacterium]|nr:hypothetical protein [bacterium]
MGSNPTPASIYLSFSEKKGKAKENERFLWGYFLRRTLASTNNTARERKRRQKESGKLSFCDFERRPLGRQVTQFGKER